MGSANKCYTISPLTTYWYPYNPVIPLDAGIIIAIVIIKCILYIAALTAVLYRLQLVLPGEAMNTGMLWYENNHDNDLSLTVSNAADFYEQNYGQIPTLCFVHPSAITTTAPRSSRRIVIRSSKKILPNHIWIGIDGTGTRRSEARFIFGIRLPQQP